MWTAPAFADEHVHLLSCAAASSGVAVDQRTIAGLLDTVRAAARAVDAHQWVRAWGYDDALIAERRHPTRAELDEAGGGRPVVVHHRTGHAAALSSSALRAIGLTPAGQGVLHDAHAALARVPRIPLPVLRAELAELSACWWRRGVVELCDATHTNGRSELALLGRWAEDGTIRQRLRVMIGVDRLGEVADLRFGDRVGGASVAHAKIMPVAHRDTGGLARAVATARASGFPVAVHAMGIDEVEETLDAIERHPVPLGTSGRDRIEHAAMVLPEQLDRIAGLGIEVVTQPSFLPCRWPKYAEQISEVERPWLWRIASLLQAGITVRFSSDAPVVPVDMLAAVLNAVERPHAPGEAVAIDVAWRCASSAYGDRLEVLADSIAGLTHETELRVVAPDRQQRCGSAERKAPS